MNVDARLTLLDVVWGTLFSSMLLGLEGISGMLLAFEEFDEEWPWGLWLPSNIDGS